MARQGILLLVLVLIPFAAVHAVDGPRDCARLVDRDQRLDCFDRFFPAAAADAGMLPYPDASPIEARQALEAASQLNWFSITPHRPNYVLPVTHNYSSDFSPYGAFGELLSDTEIKFQLSLKTRISPELWRGSSLWFAYTQLSFWQLYAETEASSPFRETNHEPELMWMVPVDFSLLGWDAKLAGVALNHQSNGQSGDLSRSWNRVIGELILERGRFAASLKAWTRVDEPGTDDNPNIEDFMGRAEIGIAYRGDSNAFAVGLRNNLGRDNRSGVELSWTFPLAQHLKGFVQIYSGYGESLIDAENYSNRIGIGLSLTDWL
jgi:phospholipase A1